jgi:hypothetical protein
MADPVPDAVEPPWTLRAAAAIVSVEALIECIEVSRREELTAGLRFLLISCLALKWLFAWRVLGLRAGPMLGLLLLEGTTILAAVAATETSDGARLAAAGTALVVLVLLVASIPAVPSPTLPKP